MVFEQNGLQRLKQIFPKKAKTVVEVLKIIN